MGSTEPGIDQGEVLLLQDLLGCFFHHRSHFLRIILAPEKTPPQIFQGRGSQSLFNTSRKPHYSLQWACVSWLNCALSMSAQCIAKASVVSGTTGDPHSFRP